MQFTDNLFQSHRVRFCSKLSSIFLPPSGNVIVMKRYKERMVETHLAQLYRNKSFNYVLELVRQVDSVVY